MLTEEAPGFCECPFLLQKGSENDVYKAPLPTTPHGIKILSEPQKLLLPALSPTQSHPSQRNVAVDFYLEYASNIPDRVNVPFSLVVLCL